MIKRRQNQKPQLDEALFLRPLMAIKTDTVKSLQIQLSPQSINEQSRTVQCIEFLHIVHFNFQ